MRFYTEKKMANKVQKNYGNDEMSSVFEGKYALESKI